MVVSILPHEGKIFVEAILPLVKHVWLKWSRDNNDI